MRKSKAINLDNRQIVAQELSVKQVDALFDAAETTAATGGKVSAAEMLVNSHIPMQAVCASTGLSSEELSELYPNELQQIWSAVAEVNSFLDQLFLRLGAAVVKMENLRRLEKD